MIAAGIALVVVMLFCTFMVIALADDDDFWGGDGAAIKPLNWRRNK